MTNIRALCRLFFTLIVIVVSGVRAWAQRGDVALLPVGQAAGGAEEVCGVCFA